LICLLALVARQARAGGDRLYGVHWWDYDRPNVGSGPTGGWSVETVLTNSDEWQRGWWFEPLYQQVTEQHDAEIITRVDYTWVNGNQTVPAPTTMSAANWANKIVSDIIGPLGPYASRWVIGNEPNLLGEGNGWPDNKVTPEGYAQIYHTVRDIIKAQRPQDEVLFAPVSPGGVDLNGGRWKDGNQWLGEAIDATLALDGTIDGFAIHAYTGAVGRQALTEFRSGFELQFGVIDARALNHVPVYLTEWNRYTPPLEDPAANATNEQISAAFLRGAMVNVDQWNRIPGNHNIRSMSWFVYNDDPGTTWDGYSLEWWRTRGNPEGHPGDLWTALIGSNQLQAGLVGSRPKADYNGDGDVDQDDFLSWRANFKRTDWPYADGNRNGIVDAGDYVVWRKSMAAQAAAAALSVPEAYSLWSLVLGTVWMHSCYRHPKRVIPGASPLPRMPPSMNERRCR
jgi:hypothetical protein